MNDPRAHSDPGREKPRADGLRSATAGGFPTTDLSEELLALAVAGAGAGLWCLDPKTGAIQATAEALAMFGWPAHETLDMQRALRRISLTHRRRVAKQLRHAVEKGDAYQSEFPIRHPDGATRWIRAQARMRPTHQGPRLLGLVWDITGRKIIERELQESRERLALAQRAGGVGVFDWDLVTGRIHWTPEMEKLFEIPAGSFEGSLEAWTQYVHRDDAHRLKSLAQEWTTSARSRIAWEYRCVRPDGAVRWMATQGRVIRDLQGRPVRIIGTNTDITQRRLGEESLRRSQALVQQQLLEIEAIYDSAPVGLCVMDTKLRYLRINEHMAQINGVPPDDHIGRTCREVVPDLADSAAAMMERILHTGRPILNQEVTGTTPAHPGEERTWVEHWLPLTDEDGQVIAVNVVAHEITERKRMHEALQKLTAELEQRVAQRTAVAERRARRLRDLATRLTDAEQRERMRLAGMLHDHLQQLLVAARMRLLPIRASLAEPAHEDLRELDDLLQESIRATRDLTTDLSPTVLRRGSLNDILDWLGRWFGERHALDVTVVLPPDPPATSDALKGFLYLAARELLFNVVKHAGVRAAEVRLGSTGDSLELVVADRGAGFDVEHLDSLAENTRGFGLFRIRERLESINGQMEVSSSVTDGTRFCIRVPAGEASAASRPHPARETHQDREGTRDELPQPSDPVRLLVVDDHAIVREALVEMLEQQPGFLVVGEASNGQQALQSCAALKPDVVLMDVHMPVMDGIEATQRIRERYPDIRIVGLSLREEKEVAEAMMRAGALAYVHKDGNVEDLHACIRRAGHRTVR